MFYRQIVGGPLASHAPYHNPRRPGISTLVALAHSTQAGDPGWAADHTTQDDNFCPNDHRYITASDRGGPYELRHSSVHVPKGTLVGRQIPKGKGSFSGLSVLRNPLRSRHDVASRGKLENCKLVIIFFFFNSPSPKKRNAC